LLKTEKAKLILKIDIGMHSSRLCSDMLFGTVSTQKRKLF